MKPSKPVFTASILGLSVLMLLLGLLFSPSQVAHASSIFVDTTDDELNSDGDCSLREAVQAVNTNATVDNCVWSGTPEINVPAGTFSLTLVGPSEDANATGDLDISSDLTMTGAGEGTTVIDGADLDRVIHIGPGSTSPIVGLSNLSIQNGNQIASGGGGMYVQGGIVTITSVTVSKNVAGWGAGIEVGAGTVSFNNSTISANQATTFGGGIRNDGMLTLTDSMVVGNNTLSNRGAGVFNDPSGTATLVNSTVTLNTAETGSGGGLNNEPGGTMIIQGSLIDNNDALVNGGGINNLGQLSLTNSTISGNAAGNHGGGIYNHWLGTAELSNVTVSDNIADEDADSSGDGGGIFEHGGVFNMRGSIVAGNQDPTSDPDCFGTLTSFGYNLFGIVSTNCTIVGDTTGNIVSLTPLLGPLNDNDGPTFTHALLPESPAMDAGRSLGCIDHNSDPVTVDQRGWTRSIDGDLDGTITCDIGAYEATIDLFLPLIMR